MSRHELGFGPPLRPRERLAAVVAFLLTLAIVAATAATVHQAELAPGCALLAHLGATCAP